MSFINAAQLAYMRDQLLDTLPDTGTVLSVTRTSDGQGGYTQTWAGSTTYDCRLDYVSATKLQAGGGYIPFETVVLTLPYNAVITTANRFATEDHQYSVKAVKGTDRSWNISVRAELEEVT